MAKVKFWLAGILISIADRLMAKWDCDCDDCLWLMEEEE